MPFILHTFTSLSSKIDQIILDRIYFPQLATIRVFTSFKILLTMPWLFRNILFDWFIEILIIIFKSVIVIDLIGFENIVISILEIFWYWMVHLFLLQREMTQNRKEGFLLKNVRCCLDIVCNRNILNEKIVTQATNDFFIFYLH